MGAGALAAVLIVAIIAVKTGQATPPAPCPPIKCPLPQPPPVRPSRLPEGTRWPETVNSLRFQLEYDSAMWDVLLKDDHQLELRIANGIDLDATVWVEVVPSSTASPEALIDRRVATLKQKIPSLAPDCVDITGTKYAGQCSRHPEHMLFGSAVGFRGGIGGMWSGATGDSSTQQNVLIMAASDGRISVVVSAVTGHPFAVWEGPYVWALGFADSVVNSFLWPSDLP